MSEALIAARQALVSGNSGDSEVALALIDAELAEDGEAEAVEPEADASDVEAENAFAAESAEAAVEEAEVEAEGDPFAPADDGS